LYLDNKIIFYRTSHQKFLNAVTLYNTIIHTIYYLVYTKRHKRIETAILMMIRNYSTNTNNYYDLMEALSHLEIDEGIRVSESKQEKKIFINKNASGQFVTQIVNDSNRRSDTDDVIRHFDTVEEFVNFLRSEFKSNFDFSFY
jgi:hypothetical protein